MKALIACLLLLPLGWTPGAQDAKPDAEGLVAQGWQYLPAYDGTHREFLTEEERKNAAVSMHLFAAAAELDPEYLRALWSLGHAHILLGEDLKNRQDPDCLGHYEAGVEALSRALAIDPEDPWAMYARGALHASFHHNAEALTDLDRAVANAEKRADGWLRYKALEWRCEVLMRDGQTEPAAQALTAFHREFSTNDWPLHIALAECYLRQRDFAAARSEYEKAIEAFPADHQAYALLGYVAGLLGDPDEATRRMNEAIENELQPGFYTRLWWWILATDDARPGADADLRAFLEHPPGSVSEWDLALGRFVTGVGTAEAFLETGRTEERRRMAAGEQLDNLMCEVWFYVGLRHQYDARNTTDEEQRASLLEAARLAYAQAIGFAPQNWKWEWAFARQHHAALCQRLQVPLEPWFTVKGSSLVMDGSTFRILEAAWHEPEEERAFSSLERGMRAGDLFLGRVVDPKGREAYVRWVVKSGPAR